MSRSKIELVYPILLFDKKIIYNKIVTCEKKDIMFGEQYICGKKLLSVDKGRIILPAFTNAETKEELVFVSDDLNYFTILSKRDIFHKLNQLLLKQSTAKTIEEYNFIQGQINMIQNYCFGIEEVDYQRRILLPKELRERLSIENSVYVSGGITLQTPCLEVYKDEKEMNAIGAKRKSFILR